MNLNRIPAAAKGDLFVISAPSGAGKTTLAGRAEESFPDLRQSVSYTTRRARAGEKNGADYNFITEEKFREMERRGEFIEWARVHSNLYGTREKDLRELIGSGADVLMDIDTQGARQIKAKFPEAVFIFVLPPSYEELKRRLDTRRGDTPETIELRLKRAREEIREYMMYDYVILNDVLERAVEALKGIILARRSLSSKIDPAWIEKKFFAEEVSG